MSSAETTPTSTKTVTFSSSTKSNKTSKRKKPLTRDFFTQLIKLETEFHNKIYTVATLDELIQFYAKAVEYYDSIKDEISSYFMFKIQDILATKKSLKMLFDQNSKSGGRRGNENGEMSPSPNKVNDVRFENHNEIKTSQFDEKEQIGEVSSGDEDDDEEMTEVERKRRANKKKGRQGKLSITVMKNEKQRFVNFFYKMETQKAISKQNMNVLIDQFDKASDKNDDFVKHDIDEQKDRLRQRLDKRKIETFNTHTLSIQPRISHAYDDEQENKRDEMIYESFLENLNQAGVTEENVIMETLPEDDIPIDTESLEAIPEHNHSDGLDSKDATPNKRDMAKVTTRMRHFGEHEEEPQLLKEEVNDPPKEAGNEEDDEPEIL